MGTKTGWWSASFHINLEGKELSFYDLSEDTQSYIIKAIEDGCRQGQVIEYSGQCENCGRDLCDESRCRSLCERETCKLHDHVCGLCLQAAENLSGPQRDIYAAYLAAISEGKSDREARLDLVERYGQSAEGDSYAAFTDRAQGVAQGSLA